MLLSHICIYVYKWLNFESIPPWLCLHLSPSVQTVMFCEHCTTTVQCAAKTKHDRVTVWYTLQCMCKAEQRWYLMEGVPCGAKGFKGATKTNLKCLFTNILEYSLGIFIPTESILPLLAPLSWAAYLKVCYEGLPLLKRLTYFNGICINRICTPCDLIEKYWKQTNKNVDKKSSVN